MHTLGYRFKPWTAAKAAPARHRWNFPTRSACRHATPGFSFTARWSGWVPACAERQEVQSPQASPPRSSRVQTRLLARRLAKADLPRPAGPARSIACGTRPARREDLPFDHPVYILYSTAVVNGATGRINFFDDVYGLVFRMLGERAQAEDVVQEVFLRLHRSCGTLDPERDPRPWLRTEMRSLPRSQSMIESAPP